MKLDKAWVAGLVLLLARVQAGAQDFGFQIDQATSGGSAQLHVQAATSGTLIGDYDTTANPTGTHTKPGFLSAPGATENVAVPVHSFNPDAKGQVTFAPTGTFRFHFDPAGGSLTLADFTTDLLGGKSASIPVTAAVSFDTFRTSNPTFTYPGIPLNISLGNAVVSSLTATEVPGDANGTLTPMGNNQYSFTVTPMVIIGAKIDFQGNPLDAATDPTPFPLAGVVTITGNSASISESGPLDQTRSVSPALPLGALPFDLPAGTGSAHVIFNLTLNTQDTNVLGTQTLNAAGVPIPEPGAIMLAGGALLVLINRRRN